MTKELKCKDCKHLQKSGISRARTGTCTNKGAVVCTLVAYNRIACSKIKE